MSRDNPTPEELDEIEQFQYGAYGAEPPLWWINRSITTTNKTPATSPNQKHPANAGCFSI